MMYIYIIHCQDTNDALLEYGYLHIPSYKTSIMMNELFREIKENRNLDALEESDDEDEFEDISPSKYVYLEKKYAEHLGIPDENYKNVKFFDNPNELIKNSNLLAQVNCPSTKFIESFKENTIILFL